MARSVKKHTIATVYGHDISPEAMALATESGAIDAPLTRETLQECDLLLIAIAPRSLVKWVEDHADAIPTTTILVDLCGVKRYIYKHIAPIAREKGFLYVGGHPMAGTQYSGYKYARSNLFHNAPMVIVPPSFDAIALLSRVKDLLAPAGFGKISVTTAEKHDEMIGFVSQLTHAIAVALMTCNDIEGLEKYTGDSFRDLTRIAKINDEMWSELFLANREALLEQMDQFAAQFALMRQQLAEGDREGMREVMRRSTVRRKALEKHDERK